MSKTKGKEQKERESRSIELVEENSKLGKFLVDSNSSVEVGYGFYYDIRSELLIVNNMC